MIQKSKGILIEFQKKEKNYPKKERIISIDKINWFGKKPKKKNFPFHNSEHFQR